MHSSRSWVGLAFIVTLFLSGCGGAAVSSSACPPPQWADQEVAEELETIPFEGYEDTWAWIDRVDKLNQQLEEC